MMRIQSIKITNYKAFLGTYKIAVGGKNLFIYGENGSGKSSLYYALKDFFQASVEDIDLNGLENLFVTSEAQGKTAVEVTFDATPRGDKQECRYQWDNTINDSRKANDTTIKDANKLKSFLTYKHLLAIHHLKKDDEINLFDLLVKGVLRHFRYTLTGGKELGELYADVEAAAARVTGSGYPINKKKTDVNAAVKAFNEAFGELFREDSPEFILKHAQPFLDYFSHNMKMTLRFAQMRPTDDYAELKENRVSVELVYAGKPIDKPHLFLNEARLSAIAISIYLGMVKRHVQGIPCKILFLDDIFIGLDIANRLPLLEILQKEFNDYQIFITTYDKPWFEYAKGFLEEGSWRALEFYAQSCPDGTEIPVILDGDFLKMAEAHLRNSDYKAAAVYTRSEFEKLVRNRCAKLKRTVVFKKRLKDYTTEDFWTAITTQKDGLPKDLQKEIETYRALVLNPFSHYNTELHEIKTELRGAIDAVKKLREECGRMEKSSGKPPKSCAEQPE